MALAGQSNSNVNQSTDSNDYIDSFHRNVLNLLVAGHKGLIESNTDLSNEEEPNITGELVRCTNEYIDSATSPDWTGHYDIRDESPENTGGRLGKKRKKVDIVCTRTGIKPRSRLKFEAKRLKRNGFTVGEYVGKAGLGEFISGNYAPECESAGMLGYVQSDYCNYWAEQIPNVMNERKKELYLSQEGNWQKAEIENVNDCYKTQHNRPTIGRKLLVYHLLLDFVKK